MGKCREKFNIEEIMQIWRHFSLSVSIGKARWYVKKRTGAGEGKSLKVSFFQENLSRPNGTRKEEKRAESEKSESKNKETGWRGERRVSGVRWDDAVIFDQSTGVVVGWYQAFWQGGGPRKGTPPWIGKTSCLNSTAAGSIPGLFLTASSLPWVQALTDAGIEKFQKDYKAVFGE